MEFDHLTPFALGGRHTVDGLRLRCRAHNLHSARKTYGDEMIEACIERKRSRRSEAGGNSEAKQVAATDSEQQRAAVSARG